MRRKEGREGRREERRKKGAKEERILKNEERKNTPRLSNIWFSLLKLIFVYQIYYPHEHILMIKPSQEPEAF